MVVSSGVVVAGALAVVSGELDDSPGLGGIGLLLIAAVLAYWVRRLRVFSNSKKGG